MKRGLKFKIAMVIGGIALALVLVLVSPIFHVREVVVLGNHRVCETDIKARLNIAGNSNIFLINWGNARRAILGNLHIEDVSFSRELPGRLYVSIQERRLSAYVEHEPGSFLFLDENGRVLEIRNYITELLPRLDGLQFTRFQLGEILEVSDEINFINIMQYTQLLTLHGLINQITHINVSDPANIRILVNYLEFHVGGIQDADAKVRTIAEKLYRLPNAHIIRGFVDIREIRSEYFLVLLQ